MALKSKKKGRYHAKQTLTARVAGKPAGTVRFYVTHSNGWPARTTTIGHVKLRKGVAKLVWNPKASLTRKTEVKKVTAQFIPKSKKFRKSSKSRPMTLSAHPTTTKVKVKGKKVHITVRGGDRKPSGVPQVHALASEAPSQWFTVKIKKGKGSFKLSRLPDGFWSFHTIFEGDSNNLAHQTWTDSFADGPRNVKVGIKDHVVLSAGWPRYGPKPDPYPVTITLSGPVRTPTGDVELGYHVDGKWKSWTATLDSTGTATFQTKHAQGPCGGQATRATSTTSRS